MSRIIFLLALFIPTISSANDIFSSFSDLAKYLGAGQHDDIACVTFPQEQFCDPRSQHKPSKNQLAIVYFHPRTDEERGGVFYLREDRGSYKLMERSQRLEFGTLKGTVMDDLEFENATRFHIRFSEGSMHYSETYTFELRRNQWHVVQLEIDELGPVIDQKSGETLVDEKRKYSLNFKTGESVERTIGENGKWNRPVRKKRKLAELTLTDFTLEHDFKH